MADIGLIVTLCVIGAFILIAACICCNSKGERSDLDG